MPDFLSVSDENLFSLIKLGNREAFTEIYQRYKKPLFLYAIKKVNIDDAEDLLHDLFVKIWLNREEIDIKQSFSSYLFRALRNRILDFIARGVHAQYYLDSLEEFSISQYSNLPDFKLREEMFLLKIEELLVRYGPKGQTIVKLRMQGYSNTEIAEIVGVSEKTVRNQYALITKHLKDKLSMLITVYFS